MEQLPTNVIDYGDGIYAIDQQMVRAFLIVGSEKALLLDTGAIKVDIMSYINQITKLPVEVFLTHGDGDHIGNLQDFADAYINEHDMKAVLSHDACKNVRLHAIEEGAVFDIGGRKLKVLFTPGHTAGSSCLLDEENKILFAGDTISYGPIFMFGDRRNMTEFIASLHRLKEMREKNIYATVYCCHNDCPISPDTLEDLIACATGIQNQTITGKPVKLPIPTDANTLLGKYGKCSILFE